jgi:precorrin-6B methylase 2
MDFQTLQSELRHLSGAVRALGAVGAALRLRQSNEQAHPAVHARLTAALNALLPGAFDDLEPHEIATAAAFVALQFEEAMELLQNPTRPPAWVVQDPAMLQALGEASRHNVGIILTLASERPRLAAALTGRFLDVGTGVGAIALEAAEQCPSLQVVGLDIWEPSLALARANISASPHAGRIEIRTQDVTQLAEHAAYTLAWLPASFLPESVAGAALDRLAAAVMPGGYLVVGLYAQPDDRIAAALAALRVVRCGGHVWTIVDMEQQLRNRSFANVETCPGPPGVSLVIGCRSWQATGDTPATAATATARAAATAR